MNDHDYMLEALKEARLALLENEVPVGAIVVFHEKIIAKAHNEREQQKAISKHAEILAMERAEQALGTWNLTGCTLYVTLEPCLMCAGAILQSHLSRLVYGADDPSMGALVSHYQVYDDPCINPRPLTSCGLLAEESKLLLKEFFKKQREAPKKVN